MAKSAQQRLNEFFNESNDTSEAVRAFQDASYDKYNSHSFASGFLGSTLVGVIMELPKHKRAELRAMLRQQAAKLQKEVDAAKA